MGNNSVSTSERLSRMLVLPHFPEPDHGQAISSAEEGVFLGCCERSGMPFFLNITDTVNPHLFITGMSGSGKTYLTKNLVLKLRLILGYGIVLIDFTGEYREFAEFSGCTGCSPSELPRVLDSPYGNLVYFNLEGMKEKEKLKAGSAIIGKLTLHMRSRGTREGPRLFIVLDEAWKLLSGSDALNMIVREGRKYRIGLILASQLIEDIELGMLGNIANILIFRIQNKESLAKIERNYELEPESISRIQNLPTGGCFVIQLRKGRPRVAFTIPRISGFTIPTLVRLKQGEKMVDIEYGKLERMIKKLARSDPTVLLAKLSSEREISAELLITELIKLKAERPAILSGLRHLGMGDKPLADAFAASVNRSIEDES